MHRTSRRAAVGAISSPRWPSALPPPVSPPANGRRRCRPASRPAPSCASTPSAWPATTSSSRPRVRGALEAPAAPGASSRRHRRRARRAARPPAAPRRAPSPMAGATAASTTAASSSTSSGSSAPDRKRGTFNFDGYRPNYFLPVHETTRAQPARPRRRPTTAARCPTTATSRPSCRSRSAPSCSRTSACRAATSGSATPSNRSGSSTAAASRGRSARPTTSRRSSTSCPAPLDLPLGFKVKMVGLGLAHQSNGQSEPFSRSWNRWYALGGLENGDFALTARYNTRIHESDGQDDNPDLHLVPRQDRTARSRREGPRHSTPQRTVEADFASRGSLQLDWTIPFAARNQRACAGTCRHSPATARR